MCTAVISKVVTKCSEDKETGLHFHIINTENKEFVKRHLSMKKKTYSKALQHINA